MISRRIIEARSRLNRDVRNFFCDLGYLEVETPLLAPSLIPEAPIEIFTAPYLDSEGANYLFHLIPSPELWMKRLLAAGSGNIFQICKSFRNVESPGLHHTPEFSILEWYTIGCGFTEQIDITKKLLTATGFSEDYVDSAVRMTMRETFLKHTGIDLLDMQHCDTFRKTAGDLGPGISPVDDWETVFNKVFLTFVEPELPKDRPVFITHYPVQSHCLAKQIPDSPWRERWELYLNGIECANCFTEERDLKEINAFFEHEAARMDTRRTEANTDNGFLHIFRDGTFPSCSGVALGMDRLLMLLTGRKDIRGVILFPFFDMLEADS